MKALKLLVAILGVMIVGLMTVLGYGLYRKASDPDFRFFDLGGGETTPAATTGAPPLLIATAAPIPATGSGFAVRDLGLATGTDVRQIAAADGRLYIHVRLPSGLEQVLILNAADGRIIGTVNINR